MSKLSPEDHETLLDLAMWQAKLAHLAGVEVTKRWPGAETAPVPAHSAAFYHHLSSWRFRWRATDGSDMGGAIGLSHWGWQQDSEAYGFAPGERFMIADLHNDQAMAFFRYRDGQTIDEASLVGAAAGEEGEARHLASSIGSYVRDAIKARFGNYWFLRDSHAQEARAWVDARPLDAKPRFAITILSVEAPDAASLRTLAISFLPQSRRARLAAAVRLESDDSEAIGAALIEGLAGKPVAVRKLGATIGKAFSPRPDWRAVIGVHEPDPTLRMVRLRARRVGTAYMMEYDEIGRVQGAQVLLDAPGAEALAAAVNADHLRFCSQRCHEQAKKVVSLALVKQADKARRRGYVAGEVEMALLLPALVPTGCVAGAEFGSIAPAQDGVMSDGKVLKSG